MRYRKLAIFAAVIFIVVLVIIGIGSCVKMAKKGESRKVRDQETQNVPIRIELDGSNSTEEEERIKSSEREEIVPKETEAPVPDNMREGLEHSAVAILQERLMELGFMENDEPTQYYGPVTAAAIRRFQRQNSLEQDGIAGPQTRELLMAEGAKHYAVFLGISGDDVARMQERLYELGYLPSREAVKGIFDEETEIAVKKFQELNQITVDGRVGKQTINLLYSEEVKANFLAYGEKSNVVMKYQKRLQELGYLTTTPDGNYGNDTVQAIRQFQSRNGLVVDGYLGPGTRAAMEQMGARPNGIVLGEQGDSVKRLQELLSKYGYLTRDNVTGYFGDKTEAAVKAFQKNNKLLVDGTVGIQTMAKLTGSAGRVVKNGGTGVTGGSGANDTGETNRTVGSDNLSGSVQALIDMAASKVDSPYVWGAKGPNSFDCSGFVYWCLNQVGINQSYLTSSGWRSIGKYKKIANYEDIRPGDIIVEKGHMGIAAENGKVIDASSGNGKVVYRQRSSWWKDNFIVACRIY